MFGGGRFTRIWHSGVRPRARTIAAKMRKTAGGGLAKRLQVTGAARGVLTRLVDRRQRVWRMVLAGIGDGLGAAMILEAEPVQDWGRVTTSLLPFW